MMAPAAAWNESASSPSRAIACADPVFDLVHRKLVADDAGRGDQHLLGPATQTSAAAAAVRRAFSSPWLRSRRWRCPS